MTKVLNVSITFWQFLYACFSDSGFLPDTALLFWITRVYFFKSALVSVGLPSESNSFISSVSKVLDILFNTPELIFPSIPWVTIYLIWIPSPNNASASWGNSI